ncbi:MAG: hypothetical protein Kow001_05670 [Acidobacteriota bacterium]
MQDIYRRYQDRGMAMVAVNVVPEQDPLLPGWIEAGGYTFDVLVGASTEAIFRDYGMTGAPLTFLLDAEGKILARWDGYQEGAETAVEERIQAALAAGG